MDWTNTVISTSKDGDIFKVKFENPVTKLHSTSGLETLQTLHLPNSIVWFGPEAMWALGYNLNKVIFYGTSEEWENIGKEVNWLPSGHELTVQCLDTTITEYREPIGAGY